MGAIKVKSGSGEKADVGIIIKIKPDPSAGDKDDYTRRFLYQYMPDRKGSGRNIGDTGKAVELETIGQRLNQERRNRNSFSNDRRRSS